VASIHDEPLRVPIRRLTIEEPSDLSQWLNHYGLQDWHLRLEDEIIGKTTKLFIRFDPNERYLAIMFKLTWGQ
jgi:hypothetical protein